MRGFIKIERVRGGCVIINVEDIACVYDTESYSNGREVVVKQRTGQEWTFPRMTSTDIATLIAAATLRGEGPTNG